MEYITSHIWQSSWAMENYHQHDMPQFLLMFKGLLDIIFDNIWLSTCMLRLFSAIGLFSKITTLKKCEDLALGRPILSEKLVESTLQEMESIKNADSSSNKRVDSLTRKKHQTTWWVKLFNRHGEVTNETGGRNNLSGLLTVAVQGTLVSCCIAAGVQHHTKRWFRQEKNTWSPNPPPKKKIFPVLQVVLGWGDFWNRPEA